MNRRLKSKLKQNEIKTFKRKAVIEGKNTTMIEDKRYV